MKPTKIAPVTAGHRTIVKKSRDAQTDVVVPQDDAAHNPEALSQGLVAAPVTDDSQVLKTTFANWDQRRDEDEEKLSSQLTDGIQVASVGDVGELLKPLDSALLESGFLEGDALQALARGQDGELSPTINWDQAPGSQLAVDDFEPIQVAQAGPSSSPSGGKDDDNNGKLALLGLLLLGGAAAGGGGGGGSSSLAQVNNGYVIDGPVKNAVVFRDTDGDGKWLDVNGDGKWEQGDEYISFTDDNGQFVSLGGTGNIIGTSMDRLVSTNGKGTDHSYTASESIIDSNGKTITGQAIDTDSGLPFTGYFIAPGVAINSTVSGSTQTNTVYVTGLSSLTAVLLAHQGITNPTQAQIIAAANLINQLLSTNYGRESVTNGSDTVDFFLSNGNDYVTKLLAALAAKAQADGADPLQAMLNALDTLAEVIKTGASVNETGYSGSHTIDLTNPVDVADIFNLDIHQAEAITNVVGGNGGAAQQSIWHASYNGTEGEDGGMVNNAVQGYDGPLGSISVVATGTSDEAQLTVTPGEDDTTILSHSTVTVSASGSSSDAELLITQASGTVNEIYVTADGDYAYSSANIIGTDLTIGDHITVSAGGAHSEARLYLGEDGGVVFTDVPHGVTVEASGFCADAYFDAENASGTISSITVTASGEDSEARMVVTPSASADTTLTINESISVTASGAFSIASLDISSRCASAEVTLDDVTINVTASGYESTASLDLQNAVGTISSLTVTASGPWALASADIEGSGLDITGPVTVQTTGGEDGGYGARADAYIAIDGTVSGNVMVNACGDWSQACADLTPFTDAEREHQGFNSVSFACGDVVSLTVDGHELHYTVQCGDTIQSIVNALQSSASSDGLDIWLYSNGWVGEDEVSDGIVIVYREPGNYGSASLSVGGAAFSGDYYEQDGSAPGTLTFDGNDLAATANGSSSDAHLNVYAGGGNLNFAGTTIHATASGYGASAEVNISAGSMDSGTISNVTVLADGDSSYCRETSAAVYVTGNVTIDGAIDVTASGSCADALFASYEGKSKFVIPHGEESIPVVHFDGATVTVTASSWDAHAEADVNGIGTIGDIKVAASADYACADAYIGWNTFDLHPHTDGPGYSSDLTVTGNMTVTSWASDDAAYAHLWVNASSIEGGNLTVTVSSGDGSANAYIYSRSGSLGDVTVETDSETGCAYASARVAIDGGVCGDINVTADGNYSHAAAQFSSFTAGQVEKTAYDFGQVSYDFNSGDVIQLTVDGHVLTHYVYGEDSLGSILCDLQNQANCWDINVTLRSSGWADGHYTNDGIVLIYHDENEHSSSLRINCSDFCGDASYTSDPVQAGTVYVGGDVHVTAAGHGTRASAEFGTLGEDGNGLIYFEGSDISVTATGEYSGAYLYATHTQGWVNSLTVSAASRDTCACADIGGSQCGVSDDSLASNLSIGGPVTVSASGYESEAHLHLSDSKGSMDSTYFNYADITVSATGEDSEATFSVHNGHGNIGNLTVSAGPNIVGTGLYQGFDYSSGSTEVCGDYIPNPPNQIYDGGSDQYDNGNFLNSDYAHGIEYCSDVRHGAFGEDSSYLVTHNGSVFTLLVTGNSSNSFYLSGDVGSDGLEGSHEDVQYLSGSYHGYSAIISRTWGNDPSINRVFIYQSSGDVAFGALDGDTDTDDFNVHGLSGVDRFGYFILFGDSDNAPLSIDQLTTFFHDTVDNVLLSEGEEQSITGMRSAFDCQDYVAAIGSGGSEESNVYAAGAEAHASVDLCGNISGDVKVQATAEDTCATLKLTGDIGICGDVTVTAASYDAFAKISAYCASVDFNGSNLTVQATAEDAHAMVTFGNADGWLNNVTITASGDGSSACADFGSNWGLRFEGDINVTASGQCASASLQESCGCADFDYATLSVTASGQWSNACADFGNADGTLLWMNVLASGQGSNACADFAGGFNLRNGVAVVASGDCATAQMRAWCASIDFGYGEDGYAGVWVEATGEYSNARLVVGDAYGYINSIDIGATGRESSACADLGGRFTIGNSIDVHTNGEYAYATFNASCASVDFDGTDIRVTSGSYDSSARASFGGAMGSVNSINVHAYGDYSNACADIRVAGNGEDSHSLDINGDINVVATGYSAYAHLSVGGGEDSAVYLGEDSNLFVAAIDSNDASPRYDGEDERSGGNNNFASADLSHLHGTLYSVTVRADSGSGSTSADTSSKATAMLWFDNGHINSASVDAVQLFDQANLFVSQTSTSGTVTAQGDGLVTLGIGAEQVATVNLYDLHGEDNWGLFNLKLLNNDASYGCGDAGTLYEKMMTINGFSQLDSINVTTFCGGTGDFTYINGGTFSTGSVDSFETDWANFVTAAVNALSGRGDTEDPGYYFGVIQGNGYLAYDRSGGGITDVIELTGVTCLDEAVLATRMSHDISGWTGDICENWTWGPSGITDLVYNATGNGCYDASINFDDTRIEQIHVSTNCYNCTDVHLSLAPDCDGSLGLRQADIEVQSDSYNSHAQLDICDAYGTIGMLAVNANGAASSACADLWNFSGSVHALEAQTYGEDNYAGLHISGICGDVDSLLVNAFGYCSDVDVSVSMNSGVVQNTEINLGNGSYANVELNFGDHGGDVYAYSESCGDVLNLGFGSHTASNVYLGYFDGEDGFVPSFQGSVNIALNGEDQDLRISNADEKQMLKDDILTIWGFDMTDYNFGLSINIDHTEYYFQAPTMDTSMDNFLAHADNKLNGFYHEYLALVDTNGDGQADGAYMAYDQDGIGLTQIVKFEGVTNLADFNWDLIHSTAV